MTPQFFAVYQPLTARPFLHNHTYEEHLPCKPLRPYVVCFWSSEELLGDRLVRVIPDTCVDIILELDYTNQVIKSKLCGIQDYTVMAEQKKESRETVRFAVRFPFWAVGRYGYADQSHLLNEFKRFHGLYPSQAKQEALKNR